MELNQLIKNLIDSGIIENQELGLTLLGSDTISKEEKIEYINSFIDDYTKGKVNFFDDEHKHIFNNWVSIYRSVEKDLLRNRVTKIE